MTGLSGLVKLGTQRRPLPLAHPIPAQTGDGQMELFVFLGERKQGQVSAPPETQGNAAEAHEQLLAAWEIRVDHCESPEAVP